MKNIEYTNAGGLVPVDITAAAKYANSTTHGMPPEMQPTKNADQEVFSVFWFTNSMKYPNIIIIAFSTKIITSDQRSHTPTNVAISTIIMELEKAYSYHRYGFIPFFRFSL